MGDVAQSRPSEQLIEIERRTSGVCLTGCSAQQLGIERRRSSVVRPDNADVLQLTDGHFSSETVMRSPSAPSSEMAVAARSAPFQSGCRRLLSAGQQLHHHRCRSSGADPDRRLESMHRDRLSKPRAPYPVPKSACPH